MKPNHETIKTTLPGVLGELGRRGYVGAALVLSENWGGTQRYIPKKVAGSILADMIGEDAAKVVIDYFGGVGGSNHIPNAECGGDVKVRILTYPGTTRECAKVCGCSESWVRKVRADAGIIPTVRRKKLDAAEFDRAISGPQSGKSPSAAPTPAEKSLNADLNVRRPNGAHTDGSPTTKAKGARK
jgi:hypothetical protein